MTDTVKIKDIPGYDMSFTLPERQSTTPTFMPAIKTDIQVGNIIYALVGTKFIKVRITAFIPDIGVKVNPVNENDNIGNNKTFHPSYLFVKID